MNDLKNYLTNVSICFMISHVTSGMGNAFNVWLRRKVMSSVIYVVPWAICDTDSVYINKVNSDTVEAPLKGAQAWDWCIRDVVPNPDKRSKDIFAIIDVYNGYKEKMNEKGMSVFSLNNSTEKLTDYGFSKASDAEANFIRERVLKLGLSKKKK